METIVVILITSGFALLCLAGFLYWRFIWFFRNPPRNPPGGDNIVSPADGTVVYVKTVEPHEEVITRKRGLEARVCDIVREDLPFRKVLIGTFMSPFDVHFNRAPLSGSVDFIRHHPPEGKNVNMGMMHLRTLLRRPPYDKNSRHFISNERMITKFRGHFKNSTLPCYVVQIAGKSVRGIRTYVVENSYIEKGEIFGVIRIGSQVDLVVKWVEGMKINVRPGDKVRAGETIFIE